MVRKTKEEKALESMVEKHSNLTHSEGRKVISHVQRAEDDWIVHTLMLEGVDVPFKYKRKRRYKALVGSRVNLTYYPQTELVAGIEFEYMKVVRLRQS